MICLQNLLAILTIWKHFYFSQGLKVNKTLTTAASDICCLTCEVVCLLEALWVRKRYSTSPRDSLLGRVCMQRPHSSILFQAKFQTEINCEIICFCLITDFIGGLVVTRLYFRSEWVRFSLRFGICLFLILLLRYRTYDASMCMSFHSLKDVRQMTSNNVMLKSGSNKYL